MDTPQSSNTTSTSNGKTDAIASTASNTDLVTQRMGQLSAQDSVDSNNSSDSKREVWLSSSFLP
jgi:hypothetical protein